MKICVLHPSYEQSKSPFKGIDPDCNPSVYLPMHEWKSVYVNKATAASQVMALQKERFDVFVNLCDGSWDEDRAGIEVVMALERCGAAFTGAGSAFYDPSRREMKLAASYCGVSVPEFAFIDEDLDLSRAQHLKFPVIVKHPSSYSSIGLEPASRVVDPALLLPQVEKMVARFGGALLEEFIAGREFTVLVTEPLSSGAAPWVLQPMECGLGSPDNFKHFDQKWNEYLGFLWTPVTDSAIAKKLMDATAKVFTTLNGSGYGRADFRMNEAGELFFLEMNPQCGMFYPKGNFGCADEIVERDPKGHAGFLEHLFFCAFKRKEANRPRLEVTRQPDGGFGLTALKDFTAGEVVEFLEEAPLHIVTRQHVERNWHGIKRTWFHRYAFPISDSVFGMWSDNPADWRPYDHACDPNVWLDGLNVVARRSISKGEAFTFDYATFCGPDMEAFSCHCGFSNCRGTITGWDHLTSAVEAYGQHVSDYVKDSRQRLDNLGLRVVASANGNGFELISTQEFRVGDVICDYSCQENTDEFINYHVTERKWMELHPTFLRLVAKGVEPNVFFNVERHKLEVLIPLLPGDVLTCLDV